MERADAATHFRMGREQSPYRSILAGRFDHVRTQPSNTRDHNTANASEGSGDSKKLFHCGCIVRAENLPTVL